ncbi:hypothetical protein ABH931_006158 [Streptacidiphilus sp. MAP12-33]|uniref:hypothetical protein n=1 Tax=Streptacidiphilus sp. MAP12-33 TaxID=3156266 RepID=UPI0035125504
MAKVTGLGWTTLSVDDASNSQQDIRNDITNLQWATPRAVQDVTGIDKSANERLLVLADFTISMTGVFNPAANREHDVFKTISSTSVNRLVTNVQNGKTLSPTVVLTDYQLTRANTGDLTWTVPGSLANGVVPTWS